MLMGVTHTSGRVNEQVLEVMVPLPDGGRRGLHGMVESMADTIDDILTEVAGPD